MEGSIQKVAILGIITLLDIGLSVASVVMTHSSKFPLSQQTMDLLFGKEEEFNYVSRTKPTQDTA
jgi:hypothetical protein